MSGIAAIFHTDGRPVDPAWIESMTDAMAYRGPDGTSHWHHGTAALGYCAMHTTSESRADSQPLASQDGRIRVMVDGYIANYDALRAELRQHGCVLRTRSEAELILQAYETWGQDCPRHIDGEYAFIVWDERQNRVFCARDHIGLRPLHYYWDGTRLVVATEIAAVLAALPFVPDIDRQVLAEVMGSEWLTRDKTAWQGILRLLPAHSMSCERGQLRTAEYWQIPTEVTINYPRDQDYIEHYLGLLTECIQRASRCDAPLACEVSGGLDSTSIFSLAHALKATGSLPAPSLHGYTFATPPGSRADEMGYVRELAQMLEVEIVPADLFIPSLDWYAHQVAQDRDLATYANTSMSITLGRQLVGDGCRVALNGQGGDHLLNGNSLYYHQAFCAGQVSTFLSALREDSAAFGFRHALKLAARSTLGPFTPPWLDWLKAPFRDQTLTQEQKQLYWIAPELRAELTERREKFRLSFAGNHKLLNAAKLLHPFVLRFTDTFTRQCARLGYEPRSPMLARSFVEFNMSIPERQKLRGGTSKFLHREALVGALPESIRTRPSKAEFSLVYERLSQYIGKLLKGPVAQTNLGLVDPAGVARLADRFSEAPIDSGLSWEVMGTCSAFWFAMHASDISR